MDTRHLRTLIVSLLVVAGVSVGIAQTPSPIPTAGFPAVGSWFGEAIELCPSGVAPSACLNGTPAIALFMTPTLTSDGIFVGNDSLTLGSPPFGPHTTAHGQWIATSPTTFTVDYTFMLNAYPPQGDGAIQALRFRWAGTVVDPNTLQGYVNLYFSPSIPVVWAGLVGNEFPVIPSQANTAITAPTGVVTDPTLCMQSGCPLVFKFTIKRVSP